MTADSRRRLGAVTALVLGVFVGLTLLPFGLTGPVGSWIGHTLWHALGAGAVGLALLGLGLALAGFERLGRLDMKRAAVLLVGLSLLLPYLVGVLSRVGYLDLVPDVEQRSLPARLAGLLPGMLAEVVADRIGVAGAVLLGFLALSALTLVTFAWHPLQRLEAGRAGAPSLKPGKGPGGRAGGQAEEADRRTNAAGSPAAAEPLSARPPVRLSARAKAGKKAESKGPVGAAPAPVWEVDLLDPPFAKAVDAGESEL
ncbi:MAG TPA: hypothetical protein VE091_12015, partial [Gemmatimonadales bacterium]|nr:hypothetical protein [Gemmatimonadales bacterium]